MEHRQFRMLLDVGKNWTMWKLSIAWASRTKLAPMVYAGQMYTRYFLKKESYERDVNVFMLWLHLSHNCVHGVLCTWQFASNAHKNVSHAFKSLDHCWQREYQKMFRWMCVPVWAASRARAHVCMCMRWRLNWCAFASPMEYRQFRMLLDLAKN